MGKSYFSRRTYRFLSELALNNNRDWFGANKARYEEHVKAPALSFISDFAPKLAKISPNFKSIPKASGGSLFRIYRDTRFSKDKSPYKTNTGMHFPHVAGKDAHAPGFYLHIEPGDVGAGIGSWQPDSAAIRKMREAIAADPKRWQQLRRKLERNGFELWGESLKRPPQGFDAEHPCIEDLKRKSYVVFKTLSEKDTVAPDFLASFTKTCKQGAPLVEFLCGALGLPY